MCGFYRVTAGAALVAGTDLSPGPTVAFTSEPTTFSLWSAVKLDSNVPSSTVVCSDVVVTLTPDRCVHL